MRTIRNLETGQEVQLSGTKAKAMLRTGKWVRVIPRPQAMVDVKPSWLQRAWQWFLRN